MAKPPLDLQVQFRDPDGTNGKTFTHYETNEKNQATIGTLTTKLGTGFESADCTLNRDIRFTYGSPRIMQEMSVRGAGRTVWEGRVDRVPPSRADAVQATGWYQATKDTGGVSDVYVAADVSEWSGAPLDRKSYMVDSSRGYIVDDGATDGGSILLALAKPRWSTNGKPDTELWYTAPPGVNLASLTFDHARTTTDWNTADATYAFYGWLVTTDDGTTGESSGDLAANASGSGTVTATSTGRRYAFFQAQYGAAVGTDDSLERAQRITNPLVYGDHGLDNIYASEVIKHAVGKYCPLLTADSTTIDDTTYAIGHLVFDGATVEDVLLKCNAFHLFDIAVWENRTLYFTASRPLDDYDYELSIFDTATLEPAGPEVDDDEPCNGVWVYYTDVTTGRQERVGPYGTSSPYDPDGDSSLLVSLDENPVNRAGQTRFPQLKLNDNCTRADAIVLGALWLSERQIPTTVGTGSARGHVKNRAGQWVPAWEIRAGDRVKYTHETGVIRRVYSTSYDAQTHVNTLAFERPASTVEGIFERIGVSLQAKGAK